MPLLEDISDNAMTENAETAREEYLRMQARDYLVRVSFQGVFLRDEIIKNLLSLNIQLNLLFTVNLQCSLIKNYLLLAET